MAEQQKGRSRPKGKESKLKGKPAYRKIVKEGGEEGVGVSKIKGALRQTRRLLAKVSCE
jgi:hypothetical protein